MEMKVGLTYACMNLKKLARILNRRGWLPGAPTSYFLRFHVFLQNMDIKRKVVLSLAA